MLIFFVIASGCAAEPAPGLALEAAWVRAMPPGKSMTAAYGMVINHYPQAIEIVSISSDAYAHVSLHQSVLENGVASMRAVEPWLMEAGSRLQLEPGGYHLMLMRPQRAIAAGDQVSLVLTSSDGAEYRFTLPVESR